MLSADVLNRGRDAEPSPGVARNSDDRWGMVSGEFIAVVQQISHMDARIPSLCARNCWG